MCFPVCWNVLKGSVLEVGGLEQDVHLPQITARSHTLLCLPRELCTPLSALSAGEPGAELASPFKAMVSGT